MRRLSLVWKFQARSNEPDPTPWGASSEVVERVELQPGEQRMVRERDGMGVWFYMHGTMC